MSNTLVGSQIARLASSSIPRSPAGRLPCAARVISFSYRLHDDPTRKPLFEPGAKNEYLHGTPRYHDTSPNRPSGMGALASMNLGTYGRTADGITGRIDELLDHHQDFVNPASDPPYHFHVYSHKHNTHVSVTKPNRDVILNYSSGDLGYRKSRRKPFEAAYQLLAFVILRLKATEWEKKIGRVELVLKGFGAGREAAAKILMTEVASNLRNKIVTISDATRIKFGGTRAKNARRL